MRLLRASDLRQRFPGIDGDIMAVAAWARCIENELEFDLSEESAGAFANTAETLLATYPKFPEEEARTQRIVNHLKRGEPLWPIFPDAFGFIMEGRHRIVAAHLLGMPFIRVARVRRPPATS